MIEIIWICLIAYGAIQGALLALIFPIFIKGNSGLRWLLALISLIISLLLGEEVLVRFIGYEEWPHLIFAFSPLWYVIPPLLFFYIQLFLFRRKVTWRDVWHFAPAIFIVISTLNFYQLPGEIKLHYLKMSDAGEIHPIQQLNFWIFSVQALAYFLWITRLLVREHQLFKEKRVFFWMCELVSILAGLAFLGLLTVAGFNWIRMDLWFLDIFYLLTVSSFLLILFVEIVRSKAGLFFAGKTPLSNHVLTETADFRDIDQYLQETKLFVQQQFSLQQLSEGLDFSKNRIVTAIKQSTGLSFKAYVDSIRVAEAKEKLQSKMSRQYTIQHIANDSGFSSLATFYRVFKKAEGVTPKAFINRAAR